MTESVHEHPFDYAGPGLCAVLQDKPVVALTSWIARSYAAAVDSGRQFAVLTPSTATITLPLAVLLGEPGCRWIATSPTNDLYDGFTGRTLEWAAKGVAPKAEESVEPHFLLTEPEAAGYAHVRAEIVHQASYGARVGVFTQSVVESLTGSAPLGWGLHEPVSEPWDATAVSDFSLDRSPRSTRLVVVGAPGSGSSRGVPTIGVLTVERTASAVIESVELLLDTDEPLTGADLGEIASAMHGAHARSALIGHGVGYSGLARPARFTGSTVPACAVFGPEALVATAPPDAVAWATESGGHARLLGTAPAQSLVVTYPSHQLPGRPHPLEAYASLSARLAGLPI